MAWDKDLPADNTELALGPSYTRNNWQAIETADTSLGQAGINLSQQSGNLDSFASTYRLFSKSDGPNTELYGINSAGNVNQLTKGSPSLNSSGNIFLSGGLILAWGIAPSIGNSGTITVSSMTTVYQATFTIEDSSATPESRAYISGIATNVITIKVPTGGTVILRWIAVGVLDE